MGDFYHQANNSKKTKLTKIKFLVSVFIACMFMIVIPQSVFALDLGIATYVDVIDQVPEDGTLLSTTLDGVYVARYPYDPSLIGVASLESAIVLGTKSENAVPMATKGNVSVRVATINGPILKGDPLTSSSIQGVAMKATRAGTAIGNALEDYNESDPNKVGKIAVLLNIQYNQNGRTNVDTQTMTLGVILRSAMATILAIVTTVIGFIFFGRFALKGVESLGRNPRASGTIRWGMILEGVLFITLMAVGYTLAYILVR